jgi:23S rRNA (guanosine2251-2'-O)-methyltransferase
VGVTSHVARSSSGAVNRIAISQVGDLPALSRQLKKAGVVLVGASEKASTPIYDYDFTQPTTIVMGNEGVGIGTAMQAQCDCLLQIPQHGAIGSLNAAAAASIFFYEARRQRSCAQTNRR